jgi:hypothetical protein
MCTGIWGLTIFLTEPWILSRRRVPIASGGMNIAELKGSLQDLLEMKNTVMEAFAMTTQYQNTEEQKAIAEMVEWHEIFEEF